ncbi:hypothetical protein DAPPUDRAFT_267764 [Daphnia pulex]|uniref:Suv3 N-terminal domain-containing protein n=1 Tax=Daphnia pulex TaxID=6669 RepID=E9HWX7_DAPPU|nr:hypothetical protein DAPPUDRAFT_267764 [Daphnia pulex]|eukprot:EFX63755.1 hypothetical protein DAPPUDRAFT_267764 [Daphnia pulex]
MELTLPVDLHDTLSDIIAGACHLDNLLPFLIQHGKQAFPYLECLDDLKKSLMIFDFLQIGSRYPEGRALTRKIVFHSCPINRVYCGPLKLLTYEVHCKSNEHGVPSACDLITKEERNFANANDKFPSSCIYPALLKWCQ